jgi:hypothetical protein
MRYQNVTPIQLGQAALTTSQTVLYTVPANTRTYLKCIDICNTTGGALSASVFLVPSGVSPSTSNSLFYNTNILANTTYNWSGVQILNPSQTVQISASGTGLTVIASGGEAV